MPHPSRLAGLQYISILCTYNIYPLSKHSSYDIPIVIKINRSKYCKIMGISICSHSMDDLITHILLILGTY